MGISSSKEKADANRIDKLTSTINVLKYKLMKKRLETSRFGKGFHLILSLVIAIAAIGVGCKKEAIPATSEKLETQIENTTASGTVTSRSAFSPTASVSYQSGMLVFSTLEDMEKTLLEINEAEPSSVDAWESSLGFTSQRRLFSQIVIAEDAIDDYYGNLSAEQQQQALNQEPVHSTIFNQKIASGFIRNATDPNDASVYWDYATIAPENVAVLNENGLVKAGGQIYQFTNSNLIKVILDGDFNKVSQLANYNSPNSSDASFMVVETCPWSAGCYNIDFSKTNDWKSGGHKKRVKVEVIGKSCANFATTTGDCAFVPFGTQTTFYVRTQAQKKNFWGNWVYSSGFSPALTIASANWRYRYTLFNNGCSGSGTTYNTGLNGSYPTPVYTTFVPATNNGYFHLNPSTPGFWVWNNPNKKYLACTVDVFEYNIPASYSSWGPSDWNLVRP